MRMTFNCLCIIGKSLLIGVFALFLGLGSAAAQSFAVSGKVAGNQGGAEPGVVVFLKSDNSVGSMTDADGRYTISVPSKDAVLVFSLLGYKTAEVPVNGRTVVNVVLEPDAQALEEVVVVGYGAQRKQFVVGSVSQTTSKDLMKAPATNVQNLLTGRLAGMTSVQNTGTPGGDQTSMLVRGFSTFNNSSPLIIVDGVERHISYINPNDVASVSVLKDAATAAIYGVRAANGVVLITTKTGLQGKATISYDGSVSFDTNTSMPDMLNAEEYIYYHNKARELDGSAPYWTEENLAKMQAGGLLGDTDWLSRIYNSYGLTQQHNISASGGNDNMKYFASIGYMDQDGILKNTAFERFNFRASIEAKLARNLNFSINVSGAHTDRNWPGLSLGYQGEFNPITQAIYAVPILPETYQGLPIGYKSGSYSFTPMASLSTGYQKQKRMMAEARTKLEYDFGSVDFLKGLKASVFVAFNYDYTLDHSLLEKYEYYSFDPQTRIPVLSTSLGISETNFNKSHSVGYNMTIRPQISYDREFAGKHNVSALAFFERYKSYGDTMTGYKTGYYSSYPIDISTGMDNISPYVSGSHNYTGFASFAGRLGYAYDKRYLAEVTLRADGSYKFAPQNRWGYFPSVALGWVISEEGFFKNAASVIDLLKFRTSFGILGSDDTSPYLYMQTFNTTSPGFSAVIGGKPQTAYYTSGYVYDNLTWSRTETYNVGLEMRTFNNRLSFEFDWFYKYTSRILENESGGSTYAPSLGGNNPVWLNSGSMDNRGFEMTIGWSDAFANGWSYGLTGILSWSRNRVLSRKISDNHPSYRAVLGQPLGTIYGFHATGLFQTEEQLANYTTAPSGWIELGALMYEDINGDGKIEEQHDYVAIGRSKTPEMLFSLNMEVGWKNLSLSALWQGVALCNYQLNGVYGNGNCDASMYTRAFYGGGNSIKYLVEEAWTPENTDAKYPRLSAKVNGNNAWSSDWWVRDGSYLRLKNLQLSYTLPADVLKHKMNQIKVYVAGTNLLTFSDFKYIDPENPGINNGYYPQQRTFSLGLNLTF